MRRNQCDGETDRIVPKLGSIHSEREAATRKEARTTNYLRLTKENHFPRRRNKVKESSSFNVKSFHSRSATVLIGNVCYTY